ncbi:MAG: hypothetical protein ACXWUG_10420, partial [Polyangiales bacterium]
MQAQPLVTEPSPLAATPEGRVERADAQTVSVGKRAAIALALVALLIAPAVGSLVRWKGLPPNFVFPPVQGLQKAPFNVPVFIALALVALA